MQQSYYFLTQTFNLMLLSLPKQRASNDTLPTSGILPYQPIRIRHIGKEGAIRITLKLLFINNLNQ